MFTQVFIKRFLTLTLSLVMLCGIITPNFAKAENINGETKTSSIELDSKLNSNLSNNSNILSMELDTNVASMTEKRTFHAKFKLPLHSDVKKLTWTYGGKKLSEWKQYQDMKPNGKSFITVDNVLVKNGEVTAKITFDLPYNMDDLSLPRFLYPALIGTYELEAVIAGQVVARAPIKLTPYDSYHTYNELKKEIDDVTAQAAQKNDRYIQTTSIGKSAEGRDIYFTIVAKDKDTVDKYENVTHPAMLHDPVKLQADIKSGAFKDYKVPIWLNNIHPDEVPGIDAIFQYFKSMALDQNITYDTVLANGEKSKVSLNIDKALEDVFFLFVYTNNPDGMVHHNRANGNGFDLNRDNSNQTQPETQSVTQQIAKWSPISFLDMHGFDKTFLIEPATPPHEPNLEYDLLINHMLEQAKVMGEAGIANTKYNYYHIPYEEYQKTQKNPNYVSKGQSTGWDDASAAYTAVYAMYHGAMGHTIEIPEMNEESVRALYYAASAATNYVVDKKDELFLSQLKIYERGVNNIDDRAVDPYLVNGKNKKIGRPRHENQNFFPEYYVLPVDNSIQKNGLEVYRMVEYLLRNGINVDQTTQTIANDGITYPAGSFVINMHQAKRGLANLSLYDGMNTSDFKWVTGEIVQNFPDMRGFNRYVIRDKNVFKGLTSPVTSVTIPGTQLPNDSSFIAIKNSNNDTVKAVNELLLAGKTVTMLTENIESNKIGDFIVAYDDLYPLASKYYLDVNVFGNSKPNGKVLKPYTISAVGEVDYVLKNLGFNVTDEQSSADILVNTFESEKYVNAGKPYIAFGYLGLDNMKSLIPSFSYEGPEWDRREGLFLADIVPNQMITAGYNEQEYLYTVSGAYITSVPKNAKVLAKYSNKDDFYRAGWWPERDDAKGKILAFTYKDLGKNITVFANDLTNNDHPQFQYRLLANSIFNSDPMDSNEVKETSSETESEREFIDLQAVEQWAGNEIRELAKLNIINGVNQKEFEPLKSVTRAEFLSMLVRAFDLSNSESQSSFTDVPSSSWYYPYISAAVESKLAEGVGEGKFEPNRAITREEMAQMAANAMKLTGQVSLDVSDAVLEKFNDKETISPYAREAVALLTKEEVIQGLTLSTFSPKNTANRAQAAVIIYRIKN